MLKDRYTIPIIVNYHTKNKSHFKTCVARTIYLTSCSESCFCRANFGIKTKETTDVSHTVLNFLSGRVVVDKFLISRSQRVERHHFERNFCRRLVCEG